jgi:hypothetical protein
MAVPQSVTDRNACACRNPKVHFASRLRLQIAKRRGTRVVTKYKLADIETRLRKVEDQLEIIQLISRYGIATDSANWPALEQVWAKDAAYRIADIGNFEGHEGLQKLVSGDYGQELVKFGCAHVASIPYIVVDGDKAVATNHGILLRHLDGKFFVERITATRWEFERVDGRWLAKLRLNEILKENERARALFTEGSNLAPKPAGRAAR